MLVKSSAYSENLVTVTLFPCPNTVTVSNRLCILDCGSLVVFIHVSVLFRRRLVFFRIVVAVLRLLPPLFSPLGADHVVFPVGKHGSASCPITSKYTERWSKVLY